MHPLTSTDNIKRRFSSCPGEAFNLTGILQLIKKPFGDKYTLQNLKHKYKVLSRMKEREWALKRGGCMRSILCLSVSCNLVGGTISWADITNSECTCCKKVMHWCYVARKESQMLLGPSLEDYRGEEIEGDPAQAVIQMPADPVCLRNSSSFSLAGTSRARNEAGEQPAPVLRGLAFTL